MFNGCNLQETFLSALQQEQIPVAIYLVNGIKLQGQIDSFDQEVIMLKSNLTQMVYKHSVSTIVPVCQIRYAKNDSETLEDIALSVIQETDI